MRIPAVVVALFLLAGCSAEPAAPVDDPTTQPSTTPSASLAELCSDLDVVDATLVAFSADVSKFVVPEGGLADVAEAQQLAGVVVEQGTALVPEVPEDIRVELSTVIAATQEAVGHLATPDTAGLLPPPR